MTATALSRSRLDERRIATRLSGPWLAIRIAYGRIAPLGTRRRPLHVGRPQEQHPAGSQSLIEGIDDPEQYFGMCSITWDILVSV